jgi:hypothetical protein
VPYAFSTQVRPRPAMGGKRIIVSGSQIMGQVVVDTTSARPVLAFGLNPIQLGIRQLAMHSYCYDHYRYRSLRFRYVTQMGATSLGQLLMFIDTNTKNADQYLAGGALNLPGSLSMVADASSLDHSLMVPIWQNAALAYKPCNPNEYFWVQGADESNRLSSPGVFVVMQTCAAGGAWTSGFLYCDYEVELWDHALINSIPGDAVLLTRNSSYTAAHFSETNLLGSSSSDYTCNVAYCNQGLKMPDQNVPIPGTATSGMHYNVPSGVYNFIYNLVGSLTTYSANFQIVGDSGTTVQALSPFLVTVSAGGAFLSGTFSVSSTGTAANFYVKAVSGAMVLTAVNSLYCMLTRVWDDMTSSLGYIDCPRPERKEEKQAIISVSEQLSMLKASVPVSGAPNSKVEEEKWVRVK